MSDEHENAYDNDCEKCGADLIDVEFQVSDLSLGIDKAVVWADDDDNWEGGPNPLEVDRLGWGVEHHVAWIVCPECRHENTIFSGTFNIHRQSGKSLEVPSEVQELDALEREVAA